MEMSTFWSAITHKLTPNEVEEQFPDASDVIVGDLETAELYDLKGIEFAYDVIPAVGPNGFTTEEDEEAFGDIDDDDVPASVSGKKSLMMYTFETDELMLWTDGKWVLWNY